MEKISGIYKITNTITNDFYIGSSKNVKKRWAYHKCKYSWKQQSNNQLYKDMQKYGIDKFDFQVLAEVEEDKLKKTEQEFIEKLKPTYNNIRAKGFDFERRKKYKKEYNKEYEKQYYATHKEQKKQYYATHKEQKKQSMNKYNNQLCSYNGETLTLHALSCRFRRKGIDHPTQEAKKYIIKK